MTSRRIFNGTGATVVLIGVLLFVRPISTACQAAPVPQTGVSTRPCTANPVLSSSTKRKPSRKAKATELPEVPPACLELKGQPIEVQEFLQNTARRQAWQLGENRASEDTWFFVRYLSPEELGKFADTQVLLEPVDFSGGKASVAVRSSDLGDGYVRVQISAHFQGNCKSQDKISPQPTSAWPLSSKGILEFDLVHALQTGFKPMV